MNVPTYSHLVTTFMVEVDTAQVLEIQLKFLLCIHRIHLFIDIYYKSIIADLYRCLYVYIYRGIRKGQKSGYGGYGSNLKRCFYYGFYCTHLLKKALNVSTPSVFGPHGSCGAQPAHTNFLKERGL
jgi:hypothetical protein